MLIRGAAHVTAGDCTDAVRSTSLFFADPLDSASSVGMGIDMLVCLTMCVDSELTINKWNSLTTRNRL